LKISASLWICFLLLQNPEAAVVLDLYSVLPTAKSTVWAVDATMITVITTAATTSADKRKSAFSGAYFISF
jgi:hypothetical protein